jgi:hypothetical protein
VNQPKTNTGIVTVSPLQSSTTASTSAFTTTTLSRGFDFRTPDDDERMERAVYAHIRALRTLGQTTVNTMEISEALSIPPNRIMEILHRLHSKGVKIVG